MCEDFRSEITIEMRAKTRMPTSSDEPDPSDQNRHDNHVRCRQPQPFDLTLKQPSQPKQDHADVNPRKEGLQMRKFVPMRLNTHRDLSGEATDKQNIHNMAKSSR